MKVSTVARIVEVTIDGKTLFTLFANAVWGDAKVATGKDRTFYEAMGSLVGISDVEAVRKANGNALDKEAHITTDEFRKWLPTVFSEFARAMLEVAK